MHNITQLQAQERLFKRIVWKQLGNNEEKTILDFGSGEGITTNHFSKRNEVTVVEPWEKMLAIVWKDYPYTQIVGNINALSSFSNKSFDIMICHNMLEYID